MGAADWDELARQRNREERAERPRRQLSSRSHASATSRRFYAYLLDMVLPLIILVVAWRAGAPSYASFAISWLGYLVWSGLAWRRAQSPGKQLMGMYVVHDGERATWKRMCARELLAKTVVAVACELLVPFTFGISLAFYFFFLLSNHQRQQLWDLVVDTTVQEESWEYERPY